MQKLFPPYIEGTLPSFVLTKDSGIAIPFQHNPSVIDQDIAGYALKIKTVSTNKLIDVLMSYNTNTSLKTSVSFELNVDQYENLSNYLGQYLKLQLAYIGKAEIEEQKTLTTINELKDLLINNYNGLVQELKNQRAWKLASIAEGIAISMIEMEIKINEDLNQNIYTLKWNYDELPLRWKSDECEELFETVYNLIEQVQVENQIGYYSTVGVVKICYPTGIDISYADPYLDETTVNSIVLNQKITQENTFLSSNIIYGIYSSPYDSTEKVYSYNFSLYDEDEKQLIETSGTQLHTVTENDTNFSTDKYEIHYQLQPDINYKLTYSVVTTNGLCLNKTRIIKQQPNLALNNNLKLLAENNYDNGYIQISLNVLQRLSFGHFLLLRTDETTNFKQWENILAFDLSHAIGIKQIWKDLSIEQGVKYQYAVQQYNQYNLHSKKLLSQKLVADFEDIFLFDGERQLNIKFNPDISIFKENILEQKLETIGSKYPFFFRNGNVKYKEFSLSGLISYNMDSEDLFINRIDLGILEDNNKRLETPSQLISNTHNFGKNTNLSSLNITAERKFKLEVFNWLNNGQIKCLKSPTEGNYLVRLSNISLSPEKTLGRMLHSFSATVYEVQDYNLQNIIKLWYYDQIQEHLLSNCIEYTETTVQIRKALEEIKKINSVSNTKPTTLISLMPNDNKIRMGINNVWFQDIKPGTKFKLVFSNNNDFTNKNVVSQDVVINNTGNLSFTNLGFKQSIQDISIYDTDLYDYTTGQITFGYYTPIQTAFDHITNLNNKDIVGEYHDKNNENILKYYNNSKVKLRKIYAVQFVKRNLNYNHFFDTVKKYKKNNYITLEDFEILNNQFNIRNTEWADYFASSLDTCYKVIKPIFDYQLLVNTVISSNLYSTIIEENPKYADYFIITTGYKILKAFPENVNIAKDSEDYPYIQQDEQDKKINWFIMSESLNSNKWQKTYLDKKNELLYIENLEDIKYIELGPNVAAYVSYEIIEYSYDFEDSIINELNLLTQKSNKIYDGNTLTDATYYQTIYQKGSELCFAYWKYQWFKNFIKVRIPEDEKKENPKNLINIYTQNNYKQKYLEALLEYGKLLKFKIIEETEADAEYYKQHKGEYNI